jgi:hypothetical protein
LSPLQRYRQESLRERGSESKACDVMPLACEVMPAIGWRKSGAADSTKTHIKPQTRVACRWSKASM